MPEETKRGSNGGIARREKLTKEQRSAIAVAAAKKRWGKPKEDTPIKLPGISPQELGPKTVAQVTAVVALQKIEKEAQQLQDSGPTHCPACVAGQDFAQGTHVAGSLEHPFTSIPAQIVNTPPILVEPPPVPKLASRKPKVIPKEFKSASSYAEKRLPLAIKEKSEHVGAVAKLDAEIDDLVRVIKALGGSVDVQIRPPQSYQQPYYPNGAPLPPAYQPPPGQQPPMDVGIDPNLYTSNAGPVPGTPAIPIQRIPNTSLGGAMDLDYVPRDDEEERKNRLPDMGRGWV